MSEPNRLAADAAHQFGGIELDRSRPLRFRLDGRPLTGFAGDTVLSAAIANGIETYGRFRGAPIGLSERFCPPVALKGGAPLPMDRVPAQDGLDLRTVGKRNARPFGDASSLHHILDDMPSPGWLNGAPEEELTTDLLVVGGGVAGLAAAEAASANGQAVLLVECRPWLGGDARYFGPVGDEETPEALIVRLTSTLAARDNVGVLIRAELLSLKGHRALVHQVVAAGAPRGRIVAIEAGRIVLATGATQRLPVFPGNRLPAVVPAIAAYHLAKRYGVSHGASAIVATQSNYGYRLALRLHDAGIAIRRVVDARVGVQSRFVDFAKSRGLTLASGEYPRLAGKGRVDFANSGAHTPASSHEADQLIVSGPWQPDLQLWMLAGGTVRWSAERNTLEAVGTLDHVALAGAAAGYRTQRATLESGIAAQAALFGHASEPIEDIDVAAHFETPDVAATAAPAAEAGPSFLDWGASLALRPLPAKSGAPPPEPHAMSLPDAAASVELGLISALDAGVMAEERGAPGADLIASSWTPPPRDPVEPHWLSGRFGDAPQRVHLIVDHRRTFEIGALIYSPGASRDPVHAVGVIVEAATPGGIALIARELASDRFIVETLAGPSPARISPSGAPPIP